MPIRLFVSHSSKDAPFVERLVELVRSGLDLRRQDIRCTSVDGYRLGAGAHTDEQLRADVMGADVCLGVITPDALDSLYVAFELGARWGAGRTLVPLLAPGVPASALRGPLGGINALSCTRTGLQQLVSDLADMLGLTAEPAHAYDRYITAILEGSETAAPPTNGPAPVVVTTGQANRDLVLFTLPQGDFVVVEARKVETQESQDPWGRGPGTVVLELVTENAQTTAAIRTLRQGGQGVALAYGSDAFLGHVKEAQQTRENGEERWRVVFQPRENTPAGILQDIATDGYSGDDIAELRARRILLDEALPGRRGQGYDTLDDLVQGVSTPIRAVGSPFRTVYESMGLEDAPSFLAAARLFAVLWLKLSNTVGDIWRLDLALDGKDLQVDFEGQRRKQYENSEPATIRVKGTMSLE